MRQFVKHSLYDRISTRPFLTPTEKRWIAFQLLLAVQQAHKHGVCHGDIKMENVMVTSYNWVTLTDFATFKPTALPEDNPADYSYFFDTSRRRTCYIAPERFKTRNLNTSATTAVAAASSSSSSSSCDVSAYLPDAAMVDDVAEAGGGGVELTPAMDIFSAGCVLIELFTDSPPFNFSNLLNYRAGEYSPEAVLEKIDDADVREMLAHMIQRDPAKRKTANEYLSEQKGKALPEYFYKFFQSYMQIYATDPGMMPDQKISRIHENVPKFLEMLDSEDSDFDRLGLGLIVGLITSNMRSLQFQGAKIEALESLAKLAPGMTSETILDRVLPYVVSSLLLVLLTVLDLKLSIFLIQRNMLKDSFPAVRISALKTLTACIKEVKSVPTPDANVFPEYILPGIVPLCHDRNEMVRSVLAKSIAEVSSLYVCACT